MSTTEKVKDIIIPTPLALRIIKKSEELEKFQSDLSDLGLLAAELCDVDPSAYRIVREGDTLKYVKIQQEQKE